MSIPADNTHRSDAEAKHEAALGEISDVLLNLEHTIARAKKALVRVRKNGGDNNIELALTETIADLERSHKRFMQDTYYAGDSLRLLQLDTTVAQAYGWPASVAQDAAELVRRLTELNREIVEDGRPYDPFGHAIA